MIDMSRVAVDSEMKIVNDLQNGESTDVRSVLIVGAGPAGLMLAYVHFFGPSFPFRSFLSLWKDSLSVSLNSCYIIIGPFCNH